MEWLGTKSTKKQHKGAVEQGDLVPELLKAAVTGSLEAISKAVKALQAVPYDPKNTDTWKKLVGSTDVKTPEAACELAKWTACLKGRPKEEASHQAGGT
jgi:hypothetical protein